MRSEIAIFTAFDEHENSTLSHPERNLMLAILRTAMEDIKKSGELYRDARVYLLNNDDKYLFSFLSICNHLRLCPKTVRRVCGLDSTPNPRERLAA